MGHEQKANTLESRIEDPVLEPVSFTDAEIKALSDEELQAQIDLLEEQEEIKNKQKELNRRAINMGLLRRANQSPRCNHVKANGEPCRAPALSNRLFCIFHARALDTENEQRLKVSVLEDSESMQLTVKQVMEQVVSGRMEPQTASLLLRAVQIANSTLKPKRVVSERIEPKPARAEDADWRNAEEESA